VLGAAPYLRIISFIVVIASLVQIVEMSVKKLSPALFRELGIFLPLMTTNCAILGLAIFQTNRGYGLMQGLFFAVGAGLGLTLALVLMASIREQSELSAVPALARGMGSCSSSPVRCRSRSWASPACSAREASMTIALSLLGFATLFALFGVLRRPASALRTAAPARIRATPPNEQDDP
jgi:hypothetical protein